MMTTEASLPADDETEGYEAPIERVLKAAMLAEESDVAQPAAELAEPVDELEEAETAWEALEPAQPVTEPEESLEPVESAEEPELPPAPPAQVVVAQAPDATAAGDATPEAMAAWTEALRSVERSINEAAEAIRFLRATVQQMAPLWRSLGGLEEALHSFDEQPRRGAEPRALDDERPAPSVQYDDEVGAEPGPPPLSRRDDPAPIERDWPAQPRKAAPAPKERPPKWGEPESQWTPPAGPSRPVPKPVTLVPDDTPAPYAYKVTIEDRKSPIELLQLHRALTSMPSVRNVSLLNYVNGVASLSLETMEEIHPSELENAIKKVMKRSCSVVPHESNVILIQVGE
jgi:hypothetical protein